MKNMKNFPAKNEIKVSFFRENNYLIAQDNQIE